VDAKYKVGVWREKASYNTHSRGRLRQSSFCGFPDELHMHMHMHHS